MMLSIGTPWLGIPSRKGVTASDRRARMDKLRRLRFRPHRMAYLSVGDSTRNQRVGCVLYNPQVWGYPTWRIARGSFNRLVREWARSPKASPKLSSRGGRGRRYGRFKNASVTSPSWDSNIFG